MRMRSTRGAACALAGPSSHRAAVPQSAWHRCHGGEAVTGHDEDDEDDEDDKDDEDAVALAAPCAFDMNDAWRTAIA